MSDTTNGFSAIEAEAILSDVSEPDEIRILKSDEERQVAARIIPILAGKANARAEANKAKELARTVEDLKEQNGKLIEVELQKIRDAAKPPDLNQLAKLLNQEYLEVEFNLRSHRKDATIQKTFYIRELPQAAEERFLKVIQKSLLPRLREFSSIEWTNTNTVAEKLERVVNMFPDALGIMADLCVIVLDPFEEDEEITSDWIKQRLSTYRIMMAIQAQVEAGRFRDFFLQVSRVTQGPRTV